MTFQEFREKVPIMQVAEYLGYKPVRDKTTSFRPVLRLGGDVVIIKNPTTPGQQLYQCPGSDERGSVVDFVQNRLSQFSQLGPFRNEIDGINKVLTYFAGLLYDYNAYIKNYGLRGAKPFDLAQYPFQDASPEKLRYLTIERAISLNTIKDFLPYIKMVQNRGYTNIGFPYSVPGKENEIRGFELRNYGFKSFSQGGDKVNSTWRASFSPDKSVVSGVYVFESAIDAMSYYELNKVRCAENSVFVSTGGNPGISQFVNLFKEFPAAVFYGGFDNDLAGRLCDIALACAKEGITLTKRIENDYILFTMNQKSFSLVKEQVALDKVMACYGKKSYSTQSIKPQIGKDWNEMLQYTKKNEINPVKKPFFCR